MSDDRRLETWAPFGQALGELVRETEWTTQTGNVNWSAFAEQLDIHYETLRKAIVGERHVTQRIIAKCAEGLAIKPTYFAEYRAFEYMRRLDLRAVGTVVALQNLSRLEKAVPLARLLG